MPDRINNDNFQQQTEEQAFKTLAVNIPGIVYRVFLRDRSRMAFFNDKLHEMTGYKSDELTTGNICLIDPIILSEDRSSVLQAVNDAIRNNLAFEVFLRMEGRFTGVMENRNLLMVSSWTSPHASRPRRLCVRARRG
jgi:PAS domain-containing protein